MTSVNEVDPWLERGTAWMALGIPAGYDERIGAGRPGRRAGDRRRHRRELDERGARVRAEPGRRLLAGAGGAPGRARRPCRGRPSRPRVRVWFNPRLESREFMIPGIVAMLLLVITTNLSSMAIVREKELGTLEQLNVTPIARWELIVGKLLPYGVHRHHRRRARDWRSRSSGSRSRCSAARCCCWRRASST